VANILAIDTSSAWCSVALSLDDQAPVLRHEAVSAGASQLLLPWIEDLLSNAKIALKDLDAIAIDIGPGAFTGVRLGVAAVQGLAI
jgi:tRNA threonylcarbamoyladenosine biosynthesis protein TsaB